MRMFTRRCVLAQCLFVLSLVVASCSRDDEERQRPASFESFAICGHEAVCHGGFVDVVVPFGTDVTAIAPVFSCAGPAEVYVSGEVQESGLSSQDFSMPVEYRVVTQDGLERSYVVSVAYDSLPVLYISTPKAVASKTAWTEGCTLYLTHAGEADAVYETASVKGRGNTTWGYPKKPYTIRLPKRGSVLGMKEHKRWVLLANYLDRTALRNAVALEIGQRAEGLAWTPHGRFVDVVLNGRLMGNYYLCEQIRVDVNRVNIAELLPEDTTEEEMSGGYLLEMDKHFDEPLRFKSGRRGLPVNIKSPDSLSAAQMDYIQGFVKRVEDTVYSFCGGYEDLIDLDSFADWWIVNELVQNSEAGWPKSAYMYKDRGGVLCAGPLWDYDYATFRPNPEGWLIKTAIYYYPLFRDAAFVERVKEHWAKLKAGLADIEPAIRGMAEANRLSVAINDSIWPAHWTPNEDHELPYDAAIDKLIESLRKRMEWMDAAILSL